MELPKYTGLHKDAPGGRGKADCMEGQNSDAKACSGAGRLSYPGGSEKPAGVQSGEYLKWREEIAEEITAETGRMAGKSR